MTIREALALGAAIALCLLCASIAESAESSLSTSEKPNWILAYDAFFDGRLGDSASYYLEFAETLDFDINTDPRHWGKLETLYSLCGGPGFPGFLYASNGECYDRASKLLKLVPPRKGSENDAFVNLRNSKRLDFYRAIPIVSTHDKAKLKQMLADYLLDHEEVVYDNLWYIKRQLLAAEAYIALGNHTKARAVIGKAIPQILSIKKPHLIRMELTRLLLGSTKIFIELRDLTTATALFSAAKEIDSKLLTASAPDALTFHILGSELNLLSRTWDEAKTHSESVLKLLEINELDQNNENRLQLENLTGLAISCFFLNDFDCLRITSENASQIVAEYDLKLAGASEAELLALSKFYYAMETLRFLNYKALNAAAPPSSSIMEVLAKDVKNPELSRLVKLTKAIRGSNASNGTLKNSILLQTALNSVLAFNKGRSANIGHDFAVTAEERLLWFSALKVVADRQDQHNLENIEVAFQLSEALQLSSANQRDAESLALLAQAKNSPMRRKFHEFLRITSRYQHALVQATLKLIKRAADTSPPGSPAEASGLFPETEYEAMVRLADYGFHIDKYRRDVHTFIDNRLTLPSTIVLQNILGGKDVFIVHHNIGNDAITLCATKEKTWVFGKNDFNQVSVANDKRLISLSLTGTHPPSATLDRQYPVHSANRLYDALIKPAEPCLISKSRIFFASAKISIPLEATLRSLPESENKGYELSRADWAVRSFEFSYLSSASDLIARGNRSHGIHPSKSFYGVGDPLFAGKTEDVVERQEFVIRGASDSLTRSLGELRHLPHTKAELTAALNTFALDGKILLGGEATEAQIRADGLGDYKVISFATHGLLREEIPGIREAALVLTPVDASNPLNDGILYSSEIADFRLNAQVAVLSACNSAKKEVNVYGAELGGLTTAFSIAGVPSTIVALTAVNSESTRYLIENFYKRLASLDALDISSALTSAKLEMISNPPNEAFSHPRFWSPLVLFGNAQLSRPRAEKIIDWQNPKLFGSVRNEALVLIGDHTSNDTFMLSQRDPVPRPDLGGQFDHQTTVSKLNTEKEELWMWNTKGNGHSTVLLEGKDHLVLPARVVTKFSSGQEPIEGSTVVHGIHKFTGLVDWSLTVDKATPYWVPVDAVELSDGGFLVYFVQDSSGQQLKKQHLLVNISNKGELKNKRIVNQAVNGEYLAGGFLLAMDDQILMGQGQAVKLEGGPKLVGVDRFDRDIYCSYRFDTEFSWIDVSDLSKASSFVSQDLLVKDAKKRGKNDADFTGQSGINCSSYYDHQQLVVGSIHRDHTEIKYRYKGSYESVGNVIQRLEDDSILVLGSEKSLVDGNDFDFAVPLDSGQLERFVDRFSSFKLDEALVLILNTGYEVTSQEWLEVGKDSWFNTATIVKSGVRAGGKVGNQGFVTDLKIQ